MSQPAPMGDVVVVHRGSPAKDVMAGEEPLEHGHQYPEGGDQEEGGDAHIELPWRYRPWFGQCFLNHIVERSAPIVQRDADLNGKVRDEYDHHGPGYRPT